MPENSLVNSDALRSLAASLGYYIDSVEGLRQHRGQASGQVFLRGYYQAGDGAEGFFIWNDSSTQKDDNGTVIAPRDGGAGRWLRLTRAQSVTPLWWGAKFDDSADDTAAIQAAIDFAIATGGDVLLPPGTARITRTLSLTTGDKSLRSGFRFGGRGKFGDGGASGIRDGSGTLLKYYGARESANAILDVDRSVWRYTTIADLSLLCVTPFACKFGILFSSTEFSQHVVSNVTVGDVKVAFAITKGTGSNGEFTHFIDCGAARVGAFFYNNSGQAFTQRFDHCTCGLLPGGTYFILDITSGISPGGGLIVTDFNATGGTAGDPNPPTNTTLLHSGESLSPVSFIGGRIEHLTRLLDLSPNFLGLTISLRGMDITTDCDPTLPSNTSGAFITVHNNPAVVSISDCQFGGIKGKEIFGIDVTDCADYGPAIHVANCILGGFVAAPKVMGFRHDTASSVIFTGCRLSTTFRQPIRGGRMGNDRRQPLNFHWGRPESGEAVRSRALSSSSALAVSGRPANLLAAPAFCAFSDMTGPREAPDAPWIADSDLQIAHTDGRDSSAWARLVTLKPGTGLYQDLRGIDLGSDSGVTRHFYAPVHELYYQGLFRTISGKGTLRVALENSATGEVYDESALRARSEQPTGPHLISLLARVPPLSQPSHFRLRLQNAAGADSVTFHMAWQFAHTRQDASFVGIDGVSEMNDDWAVSAESLRAWGRFMLPLKSDAFGSAAAHPAKDLYSDQYISADDGRLTYFAGDIWCKSPRTHYGDGPPVQGAWRVGDQMLNVAPKAGAHVGWICTIAGSPGEWRPFGLIA